MRVIHDDDIGLEPFAFDEPFAGSREDNFLTRAFTTSEFEERVEKALEEAIFDSVVKNPTG